MATLEVLSQSLNMGAPPALDATVAETGVALLLVGGETLVRFDGDYFNVDETRLVVNTGTLQTLYWGGPTFDVPLFVLYNLDWDLAENNFSLNPYVPDFESFLTGDDSVSGHDGQDTLYGYEGNDTVAGNGGNDSIDGGGGNDSLEGGNGDDSLSGGDGNDTLVGDSGNDTLDGGAGDDVYVVGNAGVQVVETVSGTDTVQTVLRAYTLDDGVENLQFIGDLTDYGGSFIVWAGNSLDNLITAGEGGNQLDGGIGNDTLVGGSFYNEYTIDSLGDVITATVGNDIVRVKFSEALTYTLGASIDGLRAFDEASMVGLDVFGNELANSISANAANNSLVGGGGNDVLNGQGGADTMVGGTGDDFYRLDSLQDVVVETAGQGTDRVRLAFDFTGTYTLGASIEDAQIDFGGNLTGNASANYLTSGDLSNSVSGLGGNDTVYAYGGVDTIDGGTGVDTVEVGGSLVDYFVSRPDTLTTVLTAKPGTGDGPGTIILRNVESVNFNGTPSTLGQVQLRVGVNDNVAGTSDDDTIDGLGGNDSLRGLGGNDSLVGGTGSDTLDGGTGADTLVGGAGNDTYTVDNGFDVVVETGATSVNGTDTVLVSISNFEMDGITNVAGIENLVYNGTETGSFTGIGNAIANSITGLGGDDSLSGEAGNDRLEGNAGNDTLDGGAGNDRLESGAGNDTLDGGAGIDTLVGDAGVNTYVVDVAGDVITEGANDTLTGDGDGDTVRFQAASAGQTFNMATNAANVEEGAITGSLAANLIGNRLDNTFKGNAANNSIDGGAGSDFFEYSGGIDTLDGGGIESGDVLDFGGGSRGSWGNVVKVNTTDYRISNGTDFITFRDIETFIFGEFLDFETMTADALGNESNTLTGDADEVNIFDGGGGADQLTGNGGNDTLIGGTGIDVLRGGTGDDTYYVDAANEASETDGSGEDTVMVAYTVAGTYTLGIDIEDGTITSALAGVNLTGNALDNTLLGGAGANIMRGDAGHDSLSGGLGADTLIGGLGNDTYGIDNALDVVTDVADGGDDYAIVSLATAGTWTMGAQLERASANPDSVVQTNITGNGLNNEIRGHGGSNSLSGSTGNDTLYGGGGNDTLNGGDGADVAQLVSFFGQATITRQSATQVTFVTTTGTVVLNNVETINITDTSPFNVNQDFTLQELVDRYGTSGNDTLRGTEYNDTVDGLAGNDLLRGLEREDRLNGGAGADTLEGGDGEDTLSGGAGGDTYLIAAGGGDDLVLDQGDSVAGAIDTVVIGAGNGSLAGGDVRLVRGGELQDTDIAILIAGEFRSSSVLIDDFFKADGSINLTGAIEQIRFTEGGLVLSQAQILAELLKGSGEGDWLYGYASNDLVNGREGDDFITGLGGNDTLIGGFGNDTVDGGAGADQLQGNIGDDRLAGGLGNDIVDGGIGDDRLLGDGGNDALLGGNGNDSLEGGDGADTLTGGAGDDTLAGGDDTVADRFVLNSLLGTDTLGGFTSGTDKIAIVKSAFAATTGALNATGTSVQALGDAWSFDLEFARLVYDADGLGGEEAVIVAQFQEGVTLGLTDIVIV